MRLANRPLRPKCNVARHRAVAVNKSRLTAANRNTNRFSGWPDKIAWLIHG
jgi:hypothetical protein